MTCDVSSTAREINLEGLFDSLISQFVDQVMIICSKIWIMMVLNPLPQLTQSFHWWKVIIAIDIAAAPYGDCRDAVV